MGQSTPARAGTDRSETLDSRITAIEEHVAALKAMLAQLLEQSESIVTKRLAVVDEEGFERIVLDTLPRSGSVTVFGKDLEGEGGRRLVLTADEESIGHAYAGLYLQTPDDDVVKIELDDCEGGAVLPSVVVRCIERTGLVGEQRPGTRGGEASLNEEALRFGGGVVVGKAH